MSQKSGPPPIVVRLGAVYVEGDAPLPTHLARRTVTRYCISSANGDGWVLISLPRHRSTDSVRRPTGLPGISKNPRVCGICANHPCADLLGYTYSWGIPAPPKMVRFRRPNSLYPLIQQEARSTNEELNGNF